MPYFFIESIQNQYSDEYIHHEYDSEQETFELNEECINWSDSFIVNLEYKTENLVEIFNIILEKARQTSLYVYGSKLQKIC